MPQTARCRWTSSAAALLLTALLSALCPAARAELTAPADGSVVLPDLAVVDESDTDLRLRALTEGAPALLLPIYARCAGTCPITTEALAMALGEKPQPFRVVLLSFDPADAPNDLAAFRRRHHLPASWALVRGRRPEKTRALLDRLRFQLMTSPGGFSHPDETFVVSPRGAWAGTFVGGVFSPADLALARRWALAADSPTLGQALERPENRILLAGAALALSLAALFAAAGGTRRPPRG